MKGKERKENILDYNNSFFSYSYILIAITYYEVDDRGCVLYEGMVEGF